MIYVALITSLQPETRSNPRGYFSFSRQNVSQRAKSKVAANCDRNRSCYKEVRTNITWPRWPRFRTNDRPWKTTANCWAMLPMRDAKFGFKFEALQLLLKEALRYSYVGRSNIFKLWSIRKFGWSATGVKLLIASLRLFYFFLLAKSRPGIIKANCVWESKNKIVLHFFTRLSRKNRTVRSFFWVRTLRIVGK